MQTQEAPAALPPACVTVPDLLFVIMQNLLASPTSGQDAVSPLASVQDAQNLSSALEGSKSSAVLHFLPFFLIVTSRLALPLSSSSYQTTGISQCKKNRVTHRCFVFIVCFCILCFPAICVHLIFSD